jgi:hypothetical protein
MDGLYPIIRRVRRPLVMNQRAAASVVATTGHCNAREAGPTSNIEVEVTARQEPRPTSEERKERHARKAKET